ncbi:MAG: PEP-CTERM sorting domain-containing protein [Planctomycetota bacterium]
MIRPIARLSTMSLLAVLAAPLATAADVSIYLSDQDDLTGSPTFGNAAINNGLAESGSLFVYVDTAVPLLGVPLDIRSTNPGVIEFTGINFFNPHLDPSDGFAPTDNFDLGAFTLGGGTIDTAPEVRWVSTTANPVTADAIDRALMFGFGDLIGLGLDPSLPAGLSDPRTTASGDYALAEITYNTLAEGSTDIFVSISSIDDLALTPFGGTPESVSVSLGAGEATELTGISGAGQPLGDGTPVVGNLIADAVITVGEVSAPITGDFSDDGFVGQADLNLILLNFGSNVVPPGYNPAAQASGGPFDGLVGQNELNDVLLNFGNSGAAVTTIPEPTSLALLGLSGLAMLRRRQA